MRTSTLVALTAVAIALSASVVRAQGGGGGETDYIPGHPWSAVIPDPDKVDWTNPNRPGYRYRGMTPEVERFHQYILGKRARGEQLSWAENAMISRLQTARRWPEAPKPNAFWRSYLRYLRDQTTDDLNYAQRFMLWEAFSRGLVPWELEQDAQTQRAIAYLRSGPFRARNWFERCFGRVEPWMDYTAASLGYDMTGGGPGGNVFPADKFNDMQITYNVSGATLSAPTDTPGFGTTRSFTGTLTPGTLSVSGSFSVGGYGATLIARVWAGSEEQKVEKWVPNEGSASSSFNLSVPVAPGTKTGGFSIHLDGSYSMGGGWRGLTVSGTLQQGAAEAAAEQARADEEWRTQVEKTLQELGYEQTPAGRDLADMRAAIAGGDEAWRAYVRRRQGELSGQEGEQEQQFGELKAPMDAGAAAWDAYVAEHSGGGAGGGSGAPGSGGTGGTPSGGGGQQPGGGGQSSGGGGSATPPDVGGLTVGTGQSSGVATGAASSFPQTSQVCGVMNYTNLPAGSVAVGVWTRNGVEVTRSQREVSGSGWVSFSLMTQDAGGLTPGTYTLTIMVGGNVLGRKTFTIGTSGQG